MNKKRLSLLAKYLEKVPKHRFNIDEWSNDCGSVCCAGGWACSIPSFKRDGLMMSVSMGNGDKISYPSYDGLGAFHALASFFGIEYKDAAYLFHSDHYGSKKGVKTVTKRIRDFIANGGQHNGGI